MLQINVVSVAVFTAVTATGLILKRGTERRIRAGHPWIYRGEVADLKGAWSAGAAVDVADAGGASSGAGSTAHAPPWSAA